MSYGTLVAVLIIVAALGVLLWYQTIGQFPVPDGESVPLEEFAAGTANKANKKGVPVEFSDDEEARTREDTRTAAGENKIFVTDGVKHSVPLDEILSGGPPKDGIPSIDEPAFVSAGDVPDWLPRDGLGIALSYRGEQRFYPYQVLVQHEIVNDRINGERVLVTYCPLCFTGIVFDPLVGGARVEFGVSGKLWNSNLLMYNREGKDESLWSQITGEAVLGEHTGEELTVIESDIMQFSRWQPLHSEGEVLVGEEGRSLRNYRSVPYGGDLTDIDPFFPLSHRDTRLDENAFVLGIVIDGRAKAYHVEAVREAGSITEQFAGRTIVAEYDEKTGAARLFKEAPDGTRERLPAIPSFWFSWAAVHPDTELFVN